MSVVVPIKPVSNIEGEAVLIAAMLSNNACIDRVADICRPEDFSDEFFGHVYGLILNEHGLGRSVNPITLKPIVGDDGARALIDLSASSSASAASIGAADIAAQVSDMARRRKLQDGLQQLLVGCGNYEVETKTVVAEAEALLNETSDETERGAKEVSAAEALGTVLRAIEEGLPPGVTSGIDSLDSAMGPIRPGDLQIIAGRPGMGKSILGMSIARGAAQQGHGVLFVSLEMTAGQLVMRLAADLCFNGHSGINFQNIETGDLTQEQFSRIYRAKDEIRNLPLTIADLPSIRIGRLNTLIRRQARKFAARGQSLDLVVVDYLQLMDADRQSDSRTAEVTQISRGLKMAAKANGVGIVALAQLSRQVEQRDEKRPRLADLRESGSIEQDADGVLFLYRPEYYLLQTEPPLGHERREKWEASMDACQGDIEFICAKRRQGQTGIRHGRFFGCFQAVR